ncbi:hypothetical protein B0H13DRAFT_2662522 [Mycena leptocephala]|nr:hypothetical protein B0H13DRAFT_2662522 [Mycena leptocephala]
MLAFSARFLYPPPEAGDSSTETRISSSPLPSLPSCRVHLVLLALHRVDEDGRYNHSDDLGQINCFDGVMGHANAQPMLDDILVIVEFISQPEYKGLIPMFGIVNEAHLPGIGRDVLASLYVALPLLVSFCCSTDTATQLPPSTQHDPQHHGLRRGLRPFISIHDDFQGTASWVGFLLESDRIILDIHPLLCARPAAERLAHCDEHGPLGGGRDMAEAGVQLVGAVVEYEPERVHSDSRGELSILWRRLLAMARRDHMERAGVKQFALASMDATCDWFFWKIGPPLDRVMRSPLWSYQLGLQVEILMCCTVFPLSCFLLTVKVTEWIAKFCPLLWNLCFWG